MRWDKFFVLGMLGAVTLHLQAVETGNGIYNTDAPTCSNISDWETGWDPTDPSATTAYSGWDYVGNVGGASGVYLGDGWVLTADHVGGGSALATPDETSFVMTVEGVTTTYYNTGVYDTFTNPAGSGEQNPVDLVLFQISSPTAPLPDLPPLTLATSPPADYLNSGTGSTVAIIGYGGGQRSWGVDTVTLSSQYTPIAVNSSTPPQWFSTDFYTADSTFTKDGGMTSQDNNAQLVSGDSGGGDFIYDAATGTWQLAGINDGYGTTWVQEQDGQWVQVDEGTPGALELPLSAYVEISDYASQIEADMAPEPSACALLVGGLVLFGAARWWIQGRLSL